MTKRSLYSFLFLLNLCFQDIIASFTPSMYSFISTSTGHGTGRHTLSVPSTHSAIKKRSLSKFLPASNIERRTHMFLTSSNIDEYDLKTNNDDIGSTDDSLKQSHNQNNVIDSKDTSSEMEIEGKSITRDSTSTIMFSEDDVGAFDPAKKLPIKREVIVGNPQLKLKKEKQSVAEILTELAAIQKQGPQKYCILGSRHISYLHQQIIELLSYALVLSENHVYTSGAMGTNAAAIRGALRAGRPDLLTVILPQSLKKQTQESQELLKGVTDLVAMPQNDDMSLDVASRLCNSKLLSETDQLVAFAFHESTTVIEATKEAKKLEMLVTTLFLD